MTRYLVCHDYGQGGLWWYILAPSEQTIHQSFRDIIIFSSEPPFWTPKLAQQTRTHRLGDPVEDPALACLAAAKE